MSVKVQSPKSKVQSPIGPHQRVNAPSIGQIELAMAACRLIVFAGQQSRRHGGTYNLHDLVTAESLARKALRRIRWADGHATRTT